MSTQDELNELKKEYELNKLKLLLKAAYETPNQNAWKISCLEKKMYRLENNVTITPEIRLSDAKEQLLHFETSGVDGIHILALKETIKHLENLTKK